MNRNWKIFNYMISAILILAAILTIYCTWSSILFTIYGNNCAPPPNGIEVPMRVVGVNIPNALWVGLSLVIVLSVLLLLAERRKISAGYIWINSLAILIIVCHMIVWMAWSNPNPEVLYENDKFGFSLLIPNDFRDAIDIKDDGNFIYFVDKKIQAAEPQFVWGVVGRIEIYDKADYTKENIYEGEAIYGLKYLGENEKYYFGWAHATDVQVPAQASRKLIKQFKDMEAKFNEMITTFKIIAISGFDIASQREYITNNFFKSVTYDPSQDLLTFSTPITIPESYRFYLHISGTMVMGNESDGMSFHAFDDENENNSWEKGKTYTYPVKSENLKEIILVFGLIDANNKELLHTVRISADGTKTLDDTTILMCFIKNYNAPTSMLTYDEIEWLMPTDTKRVNELGLNAELDFPDGYYIYNESEQKNSIKVADDVKAYILKWSDLAEPSLTDMQGLIKRMTEHQSPYNLTIRDEVIVEISEVYIP